MLACGTAAQGRDAREPFTRAALSSRTAAHIFRHAFREYALTEQLKNFQLRPTDRGCETG